jgi:repressor LexA
MQVKLTEKEQQILDFVNSQVSEKGYPPSVREICSAVGYKSPSTVHGYLEKLDKYGLIQKDPSKPRALRVMKQPSNDNQSCLKPRYQQNLKEIIEIPIVGRVAAGQPLLAEENIEDTFPVASELFSGSNNFVLKVIGDSMVDAGIFNKDFIIVRQQQTANNGEIVVALINDEATVKTYYKEKNHIRLQPENQFMEPIIVNDNLTILGKVVGVFRRL